MDDGIRTSLFHFHSHCRAMKRVRRGSEGDLEALVFGENAVAKVLEPQGKETSSDEEPEEQASHPVPAWQDEEDETEEIDLATGHPRHRKLRCKEEEVTVSGHEFTRRLRARFEAMNPVGSWASLPSTHIRIAADSDEEGEGTDGEGEGEGMSEVLQSSRRLVASVSGRLPQDVLEIVRMNDANKQDVSQAAVQSVRFHGNGQLLLTAGFDKTLRLFQVDGKKNVKVQSVFFPNLPIHTAAFSADGREVVVAGRRKFYYVYDLVKGNVQRVPGIIGREEKSLESFVASPDGKFLVFLGNDGYLIFVNSKTKQWVGNLKMSGSARAASFSPDGNSLYSIGGDGHVYVWDVRRLACLHRHPDEGCIHGTSISCSSDGRYYATGSDSGVVNVYHTSNQGKPQPKPVKALLNLTTSIDQIQFNSDSQLLAFNSRIKKQSLRLAHLPSCTVFANWPTARTPLHHVSSFDFSPHSGLFAIGNERGNVPLFRLPHFDRV